MKLIEAIIRPFKLDDVREALSEVGVRVSQLQRWRVMGEKVRPRYITASSMPSTSCKVKVEVALEDDVVIKL